MDAGRDSGVDARRLWGCAIQHEEVRGDRAESGDENWELILSEHWMMNGIRPTPERGLLLTDRTTSGREDRLFATSSIVKLWIAAIRRTNENNANEPVQLIPMPAALLAFRLRSSLGCQKRVGIPDRGR